MLFSLSLWKVLGVSTSSVAAPVVVVPLGGVIGVVCRISVGVRLWPGMRLVVAVVVDDDGPSHGDG